MIYYKERQVKNANSSFSVICGFLSIVRSSNYSLIINSNFFLDYYPHTENSEQSVQYPKQAYASSHIVDLTKKKLRIYTSIRSHYTVVWTVNSIAIQYVEHIKICFTITHIIVICEIVICYNNHENIIEQFAITVSIKFYVLKTKLDNSNSITNV